MKTLIVLQNLSQISKQLIELIRENNAIAILCIALVLANGLLLFVLYKIYKSEKNKHTGKSAAETTRAVRKNNCTVDAPFDIQCIWDIESKVYAGSFHNRELITLALTFPDAMTSYQIFEVGRVVERLCDYAVNLKEGDMYYDATMKHFQQCRNLMHALQHRFNYVP